MSGEGVSFVVPVKNGERWLDQVLEAITAQEDGRPVEVIAVDDGSTDRSSAILARWAADARIRVIPGAGAGAAAALNRGIAAARQPLVAQVDQDVILHPGWLSALGAALGDPRVAAAQGRYVAERGAPLLERLAGYELELRYAAIAGDELDHVCTGNSVYRRDALLEVGAFDESLGYGYDNDLSYRLGAAGHRLVFRRDATATHRWRRRLGSYLKQQYGLGYGRLDVVAKHPGRARGDRVSGLRMILHVPGTLAAALAGATAAALAAGEGPWLPAAVTAATLALAMAIDRATVALQAARRFADPAALLIVPLHLLRNLAWAGAAFTWSYRRLLRRPPRPHHSMDTR